MSLTCQVFFVVEGGFENISRASGTFAFDTASEELVAEALEASRDQ